MRDKRIRHIGIEPRLPIEIENANLRKVLEKFVNCRDSRNIGIYTEEAKAILSGSAQAATGPKMPSVVGKFWAKQAKRLSHVNKINVQKMEAMERVVSAARLSQGFNPELDKELKDALAALDAGERK